MLMPALLLNATYEPLKVIPWQKAITLLILGKAEMIEMQEARVNTATRKFDLPSVLRLVKRVKVPRKPVQFSRSNLYKRDDYRCQYCEQHFGPSALTFDHVMPRSRGGATDWLNIVAACQPCNRVKGDRTPEEANMPLFKKPKEPKWLPFAYNSGHGEPHRDEWKPYLWF